MTNGASRCVSVEIDGGALTKKIRPEAPILPFTTSSPYTHALTHKGMVFIAFGEGNGGWKMRGARPSLLGTMAWAAGLHDRRHTATTITRRRRSINGINCHQSNITMPTGDTNQETQKHYAARRERENGHETVSVEKKRERKTEKYIIILCVMYLVVECVLLEYFSCRASSSKW